MPTRATVPEDGEDRGKMATGCKGMGADWGADASSFSHVFIPTSTSGDECYLKILNECKINSGKYMGFHY